MSNMNGNLIQKLNDIIADYQNNPDKLIWGEVFYIIHLLKRSEHPLYKLHPVGDVIYDKDKRRFIIRLPEMQIHVKDHELVDAIVYKGLFRPQDL
jgi:hypothetical protein